MEHDFGEAGLFYSHELKVDESKPPVRPIIKHRIYSDPLTFPKYSDRKQIDDTCRKCAAMHALVSTTLSMRDVSKEEDPVNVHCSIYSGSTDMESRDPRYYSSDVHCELRKQLVGRRRI